MSIEIPEIGDRIEIVYTQHPKVGQKGVIRDMDKYGEHLLIELESGEWTKVGCEDYDYLGVEPC